jgi:asparagine N-glycosylation enzyme membrane subunit Stt3
LEVSARYGNKQWKAGIMFAIIALVLFALVALTILGFAVHILFWPLLLVAVVVLAWTKLRPRR